MPSRSRRILVALLLSFGSGLMCFHYQRTLGWTSGGDFGSELRSVAPLLAGDNPYHTLADTWPLFYPLPTLLLAAPFAVFPLDSAAALFYGLSSGLLAYALTRDSWWQLLLFLAFPYWGALQVAQWSPLMCAVALTPALLPLTILKPTLGLPVALTSRWRSRDLVIVGTLVAVSLVIIPTWPLDLLALRGRHPDMFPVLTIPGLVGVGIAVFNWRAWQHSQTAWRVVLLACMPQTLFYDALPLGLALTNRWQMLIWICVSWITYFGWYFAPWLGSQWLVAGFYLPVLIMVLRSCKHAQRSLTAVLLHHAKPA